MNDRRRPLLALLAAATATTTAPAQQAADALPVREVTVFKDGHAYVLRETPLAADQDRITLTELPAPVLGTFWPYATGSARVVAAKAGADTVQVDDPVASCSMLASANVGKDVTITDHQKERVSGTLVAAKGGGNPHNQNEGLLVVRTEVGVRGFHLQQVKDLEVHGQASTTTTRDEERHRLTIDVRGATAGDKAGVMYVQKGLRWIPSYRLDIDGAGKASLQLQATLVNDLVDLDRATVHLVVGVPKFEFEGLVDPISLQQEVAQVAAQTRGQTSFSNLLSNSIMTQSAGYLPEQASVPPTDPSVTGGERNEDLYVFTIRDVTLKHGERLVLPVATGELRYTDVYKLAITFAPPVEIRRDLQSERVLELARQLAAPKAKHALRLQNGLEMPLTTAPALVLHQGRILAQGMMRYTPVGATTDLEINTAVDICVETSETETEREPNALRIDNHNHGKVELAGTITLRNDKNVAVDLEVQWHVLGIATDVEQDGTLRQLDLASIASDRMRPAWWGWWSWPYWWFRVNGFAEFQWKLKLEPGQGQALRAKWHYFWR
jgi:hypothetical protein